MAEMDGLKKRVELIDLRLKKAHSAREQESAALMDTWDRIRDRFQDQSAEIIKLRGQIGDLEDNRDELLKMVHSLLAAVEGGLESMADETVPQIKSMAKQLLSNNREAIESTLGASAPDIPAERPDGRNRSGAGAPVNGGTFHDELMTAIEQTLDSPNSDDFVADAPPVNRSAPARQLQRGEPVSPGIRNLIARIEDAVGEDFLEPQSVADDRETDSDDDLSRDLREIEALRSELHGLRHRISAGAV